MTKYERAPWLPLIAASILASCTVGPGVQLSTAPTPDTSGSVRPPTPTQVSDRPIDRSIAPISASQPGEEAEDILAACNIGDQIPIAKVTGMGKIPSASELRRYVPLTGREPQLKEAGPAWVITIHADVPQPGSPELWTDPTCVVTADEAGYYATGPVTDLTTGELLQPEQPKDPPSFRVPPLAP